MRGLSISWIYSSGPTAVIKCIVDTLPRVVCSSAGRWGRATQPLGAERGLRRRGTALRRGPGLGGLSGRAKGRETPLRARTGPLPSGAGRAWRGIEEWAGCERQATNQEGRSMEKQASEQDEVFYVGAVDREPRAVTNALLDQTENEGFDVALIAFTNPVGDVQVATSTNVGLRSLIQYLHGEWTPDRTERGDRLLGN